MEPYLSVARERLVVVADDGHQLVAGLLSQLRLEVVGEGARLPAADEGLQETEHGALQSYVVPHCLRQGEQMSGEIHSGGVVSGRFLRGQDLLALDVVFTPAGADDFFPGGKGHPHSEGDQEVRSRGAIGERSAQDRGGIGQLFALDVQAEVMGHDAPLSRDRVVGCAISYNNSIFYIFCQYLAINTL